MIVIYNSALGLIIVAAFLLNVFMLYVLRIKTKRKDRGSVRNVVISNLAIANIFCVTFGFSLQLIDSVTFRSNTNFCIVGGFVITLCSFASITFFAVISFDVCLHICCPLKSIAYKYRMPLVFMAFEWLYALFWSVIPFFSMGGYVVDDTSSCSFKWIQDTLGGKLCLLSIFFFCYALPVTTIVTSFACIHVNMKRKLHQHPLLHSGCSQNSAKLLRTARTGNLKLSFLMTITFVLSWTPSAIVAGYIFLSGKNAVPRELFLTSAVAAKCSSLWTPVVYFYVDKAARSCLCQLLWKGIPKCASNKASNRKKMSRNINNEDSWKKEEKDSKLESLGGAPRVSKREEQSTISVAGQVM